MSKKPLDSSGGNRGKRGRPRKPSKKWHRAGGARSVDLGEEWSWKTCGNTPAHKILADIERILGKGRITKRQAQRIQGKVKSFKDIVTRALCPMLCSRSIHVMKALAFLRGAEGLCEPVFGALEDSWQKGLAMETDLVRLYGPDKYEKVLDPEKFLEGWLKDLRRVQRGALSAYVRLLRFEGIKKTGPRFDQAIRGFVEQVEKVLKRRDAKIAGAIVAAFVSDVVESLAQGEPEQVFGHVREVAALIRLAIRLNPGMALRSETGDCRRAMTKLGMLLRLESPGWHDDSCYEACRVLGEVYRQRSQGRNLMRLPFSRLMPLLRGSTGSRPDRKDGGGWMARVEYVVSGVTENVSGEVVDFCPKYQGVQIKFGPPVKSCETSPEEHIIIEAADKANPRQDIQDVTIRLSAPGDAGTWPLSAKAKRGFVYDGPSGEPGAVFVFRVGDMPDQVRQMVGSLPSKSARKPLERIPPLREERAVLPPVLAAGVPFGRGTQGLLEGLKDFFLKLSDLIHLEGYWRALQTGGEPIDEGAIDAQVKPRLKEYAWCHGAEPEAQAQSGLGPCDYALERPPDRVWVELKRSMGNWRQGLEKELAQHMQPDVTAGCPVAGLFVIFAFNGDFKPDSQHVKEALEIRDRTCSAQRCRIDIAIVDCDKPESASKGKKVEGPGDGFQYYVGPEPPAAPEGTDESDLPSGPPAAPEPPRALGTGIAPTPGPDETAPPSEEGSPAATDASARPHTSKQPRGGFPKLLAELGRIRPGKKDASKYEKFITRALNLVFAPDLINPQSQVNIHEGRKRIDITFNNVAQKGFFWELGDKHHVHCPVIIVECKDYDQKDPTNPELDQLTGRFGRRGQFGILVCRQVLDVETMLKRCRDAIHDNRGHVIFLVDDDIKNLLELRAKSDFDGISGYLRDKFTQLLL